MFPISVPSLCVVQAASGLSPRDSSTFSIYRSLKTPYEVDTSNTKVARNEKFVNDDSPGFFDIGSIIGSKNVCKICGELMVTNGDSNVTWAAKMDY